MSFRLTGGRCRGRQLGEAVGPGIRPTSERVREALFSIVGQDLEGVDVLDAFGGTGLLGLEAWSRGARVVIVERDRRAAQAITKRAAALGAVLPELRVVVGDVLRLDTGAFDGILADPPWADEVGPILDALAPRARSWLVLEADARTACPDRAGRLGLDRQRAYGRTTLWVYRPDHQVQAPANHDGEPAHGASESGIASRTSGE